MPNKELLTRYAWLKTQMTKLESEIEMIKPSVLEEVQEIKKQLDDPSRPIELTDYPGYTLDVRPGKRKWEYTPSTQEWEKELKEIQKVEQQLGKAIAVEGEPILVFTSPKE